MKRTTAQDKSTESSSASSSSVRNLIGKWNALQSSTVNTIKPASPQKAEKPAIHSTPSLILSADQKQIDQLTRDMTFYTVEQGMPCVYIPVLQTSSFQVFKQDNVIYAPIPSINWSKMNIFTGVCQSIIEENLPPLKERMSQKEAYTKADWAKKPGRATATKSSEEKKSKIQPHSLNDSHQQSLEQPFSTIENGVPYTYTPVFSASSFHYQQNINGKVTQNSNTSFQNVIWNKINVYNGACQSIGEKDLPPVEKRMSQGDTFKFLSCKK